MSRFYSIVVVGVGSRVASAHETVIGVEDQDHRRTSRSGT